MDKLLIKIKKLIPTKLFKALQPAYHFLLGWIAALWYGNPSEKIIVIGVTGTTGKTTCVYLIAKALEADGIKVGYTSTAMFNDGEREWLNDKKMTMVGRFFSQRMLKQMVNNGCQYAIIETTSEGVVQYRHRFINYDILVFTGLYAEHIESHGSFENYKLAKGKLFEHLKRGKTKYADDLKLVNKVSSNMKKIDNNRVKKTIIYNADDEHAGYFSSFWSEQKIGFWLKNIEKPLQPAGENLKLIIYGDINMDQTGTSFNLYTEEIMEGNANKIKTKINLQLLGDFNATNAMTAICVGLSQDLSLTEIKRGIEQVTGIPGRLERIDEGQDFTVIVDYAFEPKALIKLYDTVKHLPHNKIIHILGSAGGGRDVARRPKLGQIAGENADVVIITDEDPYDEDPEIIIDQVSLGVEKTGKKIDENLFKILNRREAIKKALIMAKTRDIILLTGKGSEQAICVANGEKITWDDRAVVRGLLNEDILMV